MTGGCASTKGGVKLLSLPIKVYARVLERRVRALVELRIQEKQYGFHPGWGTLDQFFTLSGILEDAWEFVQTVYMCFVDLEKTFDHVPRGVLWDVPREYAAAMMWVLHWSITVKRELSVKAMPLIHQSICPHFGHKGKKGKSAGNELSPKRGLE